MRELDRGGVPNIRDLGGLTGCWGETRYGRAARGPRRELIPEQGWRAAPECWPHNLRILPGLVAAALTTLAAAEPGILVHCSAGRDRTGMVTAILLANAGVAPGVVADDYAQSVRAMAGVASHAPTHDRQTAWSDEQVKVWIHRTRPLVERFASGIPAHLEMIGLSETTRDRLRALLLDA